jgi:hypothetical protein
VITTFDSTLGISYGSHSALFVATPGQESFLYDPAGSFNSDTRGSGGYFTGVDASLPDYVNYQQQMGSVVQIVPLNTTVPVEQSIIQNAMDLGDPRGLNCASSVSSAIGGNCGVKTTRFPGTLYSEATGSSCPAR